MKFDDMDMQGKIELIKARLLMQKIAPLLMKVSKDGMTAKEELIALTAIQYQAKQMCEHTMSKAEVEEDIKTGEWLGRYVLEQIAEEYNKTHR
jgi:hypothetical protein